ncbi:MAG: MarR family transcriptional regulator [Myxococcales bacterium]|nr:MarR family transcriptional regulator [Myxococcales bacterium]
MSTELEDDVLRALRRIMRAIDLHSRQLATAYGLTGPQLVSLRVIADRGPISPSLLAREVSLSQATITGIVDRLAARQLVQRERSSRDRRVVTVTVTEAGRALIETAPSPLQERFVARLHALSDEEQAIIRLTLGKIVRMMGGEDIDAAPVLASEEHIQAPAAVPTDSIEDPREADDTRSTRLGRPSLVKRR